MAIDPTTPLTPIIPTVPAGTAPDSVAVLQAMARAALTNTTNQLGEIVGRPGATPAKTNMPVEQAGQTSTQDTGHTADAPSAKGAPVTQNAAVTARAAPETRLARAVRTAAAEAVPRQAGLAPLMANVRAVVDRSDMPTEVREAGRALLAKTPSAAEITTPQGLRKAVERSGVFLEAKMARAAVTPPAEAAQRPEEAPDLKAALLVFRGALSAWLAKAAPQVLDIDTGSEAPHTTAPEGKGEGAAPAAGRAPTASIAPPQPAASPVARPVTGAVMPNATPAPGTAGSAIQAGGQVPVAPQTPNQVSPGQAQVPAAAEQALRSPVGEDAPAALSASVETQVGGGPSPARPLPPGVATTSSPAPRTAFATPAAPATPSSPHEVQSPVSAGPMATTPEGAEEAPPTPAPAAKQAPPEDDALAARFASFVATPKSTPTPQASARAALSALVQLGLMAEEAGREDAAPHAPATDAKPVLPRGYGAASAEAAGPKVPPPPYAGGPMAGQKPTAPEVPENISTTEVVRRLLKGTGGALARQDLMQIASLPEAHHHEAETVETRQHGARLNLDLPFVTPQGVAVAQFEISHDGGGTGGGAVGPAERTYKARFSIDLEPLGPVHALVTLTGARARVSLWAERAETIARLRAGEESLGAALRQAELSPEVAVHSGGPPTRGGGPLGHFVDQAS